jgi:hypothetical protein
MIVWKSIVGEGREEGRLRYEGDIKMGTRNEGK